jgi:hypothetical protein
MGGLLRGESRGGAQMSEQIIIPDRDEIRPRRKITRAEIADVLEKHQQLKLQCRSTLDRAFEIGLKFRCWHDLIPHGKWLQWLRQNIPEISERSVQVYLSLWDNKEAIEAHFKSADSADLAEEPSIKNALDFVSSRRTVKIKLTTERSNVRSVTYAIRETQPITATSYLRDSVPEDNDQQVEPVSDASIESSEMPLESDTQSDPEPSKATDVEPSQTAQDITRQQHPSYLDKLQYIEPTWWFIAINTANEAIRELERLQEGYRIHLHYMVDNHGDQKEAKDLIQMLSKVSGFDFEQVKKILTETERLPIPDETDYNILNGEIMTRLPAAKAG